MSASSARRRAPESGRWRARRRVHMLALTLGFALLACALLLGSGAAWAQPTGTGVAPSGAHVAAATTPAAQTPTAAATIPAPPVPAPTPVTLTSNGLVIFTVLGCIIGVLGLLAFGVAWITLLSDGWGPMIKALLLGNRRGRMRFARKGQNSREQVPEPWERGVPGQRDRAGWR